MRVGGATVAVRLQECCDEGLPAVISSLTMSSVCRGRFTAMGSDGRTLLLELIGPEAIAFEPLSYCCITYVQRGRGWMFTATVREQLQDEGVVRLALRAPECLVATESRRAVRIPLPAGHGLEVSLCRDGQTWAAQPVNISRAGLLLTFSGGPPKLEIGAAIEVALRLDQTSVTLRAEVARREPGGFGVRFTDYEAHAESNLPEALGEIVDTLEGRWSPKHEGQ